LYSSKINNKYKNFIITTANSDIPLNAMGNVVGCLINAEKGMFKFYLNGVELDYNCAWNSIHLESFDP